MPVRSRSARPASAMRGAVGGELGPAGHRCSFVIERSGLPPWSGDRAAQRTPARRDRRRSRRGCPRRGWPRGRADEDDDEQERGGEQGIHRIGPPSVSGVVMGRSSLRTGPLIRSSSMSRTRTSSDLELLVTARSRGGRAAPPPARAGPPRRDPRRPPRTGQPAPVDAGRWPASCGSRAGSSSRRTSSSSPRAISRAVPAGSRGSRPAPGRPTRASRPVPDLPAFAFDFRPGRPDVSEFPRAAWLRSLRRVLGHAPSERLAYLGGRGVPELRDRPRFVPQPRSGHRRRPRRRRRLHRLRPGPRDQRPGPPGRRGPDRRRRGPVRSGVPRRDPGGRAGVGRDPGRRPRTPRRPAGRDRRGRRRRRPPPISTRPAASCRRSDARRWSPGPSAAAADHRGRLRRGVPLRPRADRRDPGPRPGAGRLRRLGEQDPRPGPAPRLVAGPAGLIERDRRDQAGGRHGLGRPRPARLRRRPRARRARPPPPPDAADLSRPARRPARAPSPADLPELRPERRVGRAARPRAAPTGRRRGGRRRGRRRGRDRARGAGHAAGRARAGRADLRLRRDRGRCDRRGRCAASRRSIAACRTGGPAARPT